MNLIRQVIIDLRKEIGWVLLYGMLTAMVIITLVLAALSYRQVAAQSGAIGRFVDGNVSIVQVKEKAYQLAELPHKETDAPKESMPLEEYYAKALSPDGNAGTYAVLYGYHGYQQLFLLLGAYTDLTPYTPDRDADVVFAVTNDIKEQAEKTIQIGSSEYPLDVLPANMDLYYPLGGYITAESGMLQNSLFVFSKNYGLIRELFPESSYWELRDKSAFLPHLVLKDPSFEDETLLQSVIAGSGSYAVIQSMENYLQSTEASGVRTHRTYLSFYIASALVLIGAMLFNIYRVLKRKIPDYATHHLFGATERFIFVRMYLFSLLYHTLPVLGAIFVLKANEMATPFHISLVIFVVAATAFILTAIVHISFSARFEQGLRRE